MRYATSRYTDFHHAKDLVRGAPKHRTVALFMRRAGKVQLAWRIWAFTIIYECPNLSFSLTSLYILNLALNNI